MVTAARDVAESLWKQQSVWSQTADRLKRDLSRWRAAGLALTVAGAVLATLGTQLTSVNTALGKGLIWAGAVAVGLVPVVRPRFGSAAVEAWTRARSVSETLKEQVYSFLAGVGPYRDADAGRRLIQQTDPVLAAVDDLHAHTIGIEAVGRALPPVRDVETYLAVRVDGQINDYYRKQASRLRQRLRWVRAAELALAVTAVLLAATSGSLGVDGTAAWMPVVSTVGAAVAAHAAAARYEFIMIEYSRTAAQLERLRNRRDTRAGDAERADDQLVADCERVISAQNEAWMSRISRDSGPAAASSAPAAPRATGPS